jgi:hypothetical protein
MTKRGPRRVLDRELQYWELMGSGVGTVEPCRITSVSRSTGYRWRAEKDGVIVRAATIASATLLVDAREAAHQRPSVSRYVESGDISSDRSVAPDGLPRAVAEHCPLGRDL